MEAIMLGLALEHDFKEVLLTAAFDNIVVAYYEEYTDATEMHGEAYSAVECLFNICFPSGENRDGRELEEIVRKVSD